MFKVESLFVCYISGLDLRRVNKKTTPFLAAQLDKCPWQRYKNLPSNELFPTLVTGVDPSVHGVWGVKLRPQEKATAGTSRTMAISTMMGMVRYETNCFFMATNLLCEMFGRVPLSCG